MPSSDQLKLVTYPLAPGASYPLAFESLVYAEAIYSTRLDLIR